MNVDVKMFFVVVCIITGVISSEGTYLSQNLALGIPHPLTINREILQSQLLPGGIRYVVQDEPEKDISYAVSYEDYQYLKQHKLEGQDSPFNPDPIEPSPTIAEIKDKHKRDHVKYNVPRSDAVLIQSAETNSINGYTNIPVSAPILPEVHKHVYFHVPPADFEDTLAAPAVNEPAKNLNILFIKVPSYEPKQTYLQQLLQSQQRPIEEKTLIYVLSKNQNLPQPVVLPPKPSAPEVYFVKYNNPTDIEPINNELSLSSLLQNVSSIGRAGAREIRDP